MYTEMAMAMKRKVHKIRNYANKMRGLNKSHSLSLTHFRNIYFDILRDGIEFQWLSSDQNIIFINLARLIQATSRHIGSKVPIRWKILEQTERNNSL